MNEHDSNIEGRVLEAGKGGHLKPLVYRKRSEHWSIAHERDQSLGYTYALINRLSSPAPSRKPIRSTKDIPSIIRNAVLYSDICTIR